MLRVLHLHETGADYHTSSAIDALCADASGAIMTERRSIGRGGDYSLPVFALTDLRRSRGSDAFDIIHTWGPTALRVAAFARSGPIVYTPTFDPPRGEVRWVRSIGEYRNVQLISPTDSIRRRFVERGVPLARTHLIRPGVNFANARRRRNDALRAELGLQPDHRVTLAPGESTRQSGHEDAVFAMSVLNVVDTGSRLLTWGRGPHADVVRRFAGKLQEHAHVDAERTLGRSIAFHELLSATDEVLITAIAPVPTLPICLCMAAGLPIVSTVTPTIAELLEDRHTALLIGKHSPRAIAQRILDLRSDPSLQWSIADMAHTEAYEFFSISRFLEQHRSAYQQIAEGKQIEITQPAPGGGMRFIGRA